MPSTSKAQRRAAGMAKAIQEGKMKGKPGTASAEMAKMDPDSLEHFASTSESGLPRHVRPAGHNPQQRRDQNLRQARGKGTRRGG